VNDQELRALVREAVERHLGHSASPPPAVLAQPAPAAHPSFLMYLTLVNDGEACLIEPAVSCNHCGYCRTHGH
jgi:hypothetical protein